MILAFTLSMPGVGSWNSQWSGFGKCYVIVKSVSPKKADLAGKYFSYDFGDGWRAGVSVRQVDASEARKLRRRSDGFAGYDWMVDEILTHRRILTLAERCGKKEAA